MTERATQPGRTAGRLYCCEAGGYSLFHLKIYREGTIWFTESGRILRDFLTEMFHESNNVKFAKAVIPAQNRVVYFRLINGSAKATYEEAIEKGPVANVEKPGRRNKKRADTAGTYEQPNLGEKQ